MLTELLMQDERRAGRAEGRTEDRKDSILELLSEFGSVPDELRNKIMNEQGIDRLKMWFTLARRVDSIEQFVERMD